MYAQCGYTLFWSVQHLPLLFLTPLPLLPFFNSFQYTSLYPLPSQILCFMILLMLYHSLFLFFFYEFHRVVPLLLTCCSYEFVYDHVCFCLYVYLLNLSSMYERKHAAFAFLSLAYFT
jgi:hypothetical protein